MEVFIQSAQRRGREKEQVRKRENRFKWQMETLLANRINQHNKKVVQPRGRCPRNARLVRSRKTNQCGPPCQRLKEKARDPSSWCRESIAQNSTPVHDERSEQTGNRRAFT